MRRFRVALALVLLTLSGRAAIAADAGKPDSSAAAAAQPREPSPSDWRTVVSTSGPETVPVVALDGTLCLAANDFARLLDATKFWRGDLRKLVLRTAAHRVQLTVDLPFVIVDARTLRLEAPVRSVSGQLFVPVAIIDSLPRDSLTPRLHYDSGREAVLRVPPAGIVSPPHISVEGGMTRLTFPADLAEEVAVASRARAHFRVRFSGYFAGVVPDGFPTGSLVRSMRPIPSASGSAFEFEIAPDATGYRLTPDPPSHRVTLIVDRNPQAELETFAPEEPPGPRAIKVVVLDPGHGGSDAGVTVQGAVEKDLALGLARLVKVEIERRLRARVVLTRDDDRDLSEDDRAQRANRARPDLVLSLHFDGVQGGLAHGATAFVAPATYGAPAHPEGAGLIPLVPWRDVGSRHAVRSRELAEAILSALELHAKGPTRLHEMLPYPLLGVNAPGILLECATLTSPVDRSRITKPDGLANLATTIVDGIEAYQRNQ